MWTYAVKLTKDDNGTYLAACPAFPEVTTFGKDPEDACSHALDAIEEAIAARMAEREPIPAPSRSRSRHAVALPAQTVAKVLLYREMLAKNVTKSALARSMKRHRPEIDRLLNLKHASRLDIMEEAFGALGSRVRIELEKDGDNPGAAASGLAGGS